MSGRHAFVEGKPARTYGYSAPVLGPVIRVRRGDEVQMVVENRLNTATTVHWHGLLVPGRNDGGPQQALAACIEDRSSRRDALVPSSSARRHRSADLHGPDGDDYR
jgi:hypothetical protein